MKLVLDTNAYSGLMRGHEGVAQRVREADRVYLPAPVVANSSLVFVAETDSGESGNSFNVF